MLLSNVSFDLHPAANYSLNDLIADCWITFLNYYGLKSFVFCLFLVIFLPLEVCEDQIIVIQALIIKRES